MLNPSSRVTASPLSESIAVPYIIAAAISVAAGAAVALTPGSTSHVVGLFGVAAIAAVLVPLVRPYLLCCGGIALVSADRLLAVPIGDVTIKLSHLLFGGALVGATLARQRLVRGRSPDASSRLGPFWLAIAALVATQVFALLLGAASGSTTIGRGLVIFGGALIPLAAILLTINTTRKFHIAVATFILAQVAIACLGLFQLIAFQIGLPEMLGHVDSRGGLGRISALSNEAGDYAPYLVSAIPLAIYFVTSRSTVVSLPPGPVAALLLGTLVLTNTRTAYIGGLAALALSFVVFRTRRIVHYVRVLVPILAAAAVILALAGPGRSNLVNVVTGQVANLGDPTADLSTRERNALYTAGLRIFRDHPVAGIGDGNLGNVLPQYGFIQGTDEPTLHSVPLEVAVESGIIGLAALAFLYIQLWSATRRGPPSTGRDADMVKALLLGAFVVMVVNGLFNTWLWDLRFWSVLGLAMAGWAIVGRRVESGPDLPGLADTR